MNFNDDPRGLNHKVDLTKLEWKTGTLQQLQRKELLNVDNGTVKLIRILPQQTYPEHFHPNHTEYAFVLSGKPLIRIGGDEYLAQPNEFYIFPASTKHSIQNHADDECVIILGSITNKQQSYDHY
ncbi:MAG: cupin domain-containing protein [Chlorobi bacterium]|nr:MAG: cupin domain-containing protein [Bacteroidota bacterium]KXK34928.1 MAG: Cupin domain protein [Chlorobi bacterium OLB6]MBE2266472.1 cupin domain-containing protein [Flavobacteriales bacterium]MBL1161832.1 cupin domain-containing protein [Chlorobiota bacterium]MBW7853497.1 cupin domain-containing protein [Candidatus Kapabacteria bacterium]MCC6331580.1 cupin domain-containing protein [Ignavibacteria bacterium]